METAAAVAWIKGLSLLQVALGTGGTLLAVLVLAVLWRRVRKPSIAVVKDAGEPRGLCAKLKARFVSVVDMLDYLATRREWRYGQPWMLMLGEPGAGKSSVIASVSSTWRHVPPARAGELAAPGASWAFFRHGVLVDVDGKLSASEPDSSEALQWRKALAALNGLRPERPLDGVLLCVSARTLRGANNAQREAMASLVNRQLSQLQASIEFVLPVYVVVTQCDNIAGFGAFWRNQPATRRTELFGYSACAQDRSAQPGEWADAAFDVLGKRLRELQVEVAAHRNHVREADDFFLFPGHFTALRTPLGQWLETVFRSTAWQSGYLFRGVYFTGAIDAEGAPGVPARTDVSFVDALVGSKALREPNLARPTRQGIWSRNRLIRAMQIGGVVATVGLFIALGFAAVRFDREVDTLVSAIDRLGQTTPANARNAGCLGRELVYPLLSDVARIRTNTTYLAVPASWVDNRVTTHSAERIGKTTVGRVLMPAIACHLEVRARHMMGTAHDVAPKSDELADRRTALRKLVGEVQDLETNLARYETLLKQGDSLEEGHVLDTLYELGSYAFGAPMPQETRRRGGILDDAFEHLRLATAEATAAGADRMPVASPVLPTGLRLRLSRQIQEHANGVRQALSREVSKGGVLLASLAAGEEPVLDNTRKFASWLAWTRESWLSSSAERNPCVDIRESVRPGVEALMAKYAYTKELTTSLARFDNTQCYRQEMSALAGLQLSPYGPLFQVNDNGMELSAALQGELSGFPALVSLGFIRLAAPQAFTCTGNAASWRSTEVAEAAGYLREYENFAKAQKLPPLPAGGRPLYDRMARRALERAMDDAMRRAQQLPQSGFTQVSIEAVSRADEELARIGGELTAAKDSMRAVLKAYTDYGFSSGGAAVRQCLRDFASDSLGRVSALASASRLYAPQATASGDEMFALGNLPVLKDYLARQFARAQVLGGYAAPFVSLMQMSPAVNDAHRDTDESLDYWNNTVAEINAHAQGKETSGQAAAVENYFKQQLAGLSYSNCDKVLDAYQSPDPGNDLFSERRTRLEQQVDVRCVDRRQAQGLEAYEVWAARFNRELAGRYPFGEDDARDAALSAVKSFFMDYDAQRGALQTDMAGLPAKDWADQHRFIGQLDAVATFFRASLTRGESSDPVKLAVTFRALPKSTQGGDQVVSWLLTSGLVSAGYPNRATAMDWMWGQPLVLDLSWADRSVWTPQADNAQRDLTVEGKVASFVASGPWALLRMIDSHRPEAVATQDPLNPKQRLLEFRVPLVGPNGADGKPQRGTARLYLGLLLGGTDAKTQAATTLKLPAFPRSAPME